MMKYTPALIAILISTCAGFLVVQLDVSVVNVSLEALRQAFKTDLTGLQWVINCYALVFSALLILGGALGDKIGARKMYVTGFIIFTVGSVGCGLATGMPSLLLFRAVQGVGGALLVPTSLTLIRHTFHDAHMRRTAVALWGACGGIAMAAGPVLGGMLIQTLGWRSVFLINVPLGLIAITLILWAAPASARADKGMDYFGQLAIAVSIAALSYALTESGRSGWTAVPVVFMVISVLSFIGFFMIERNVSHPMIPPHLMSNKVLIATCLSGAVINFTFFGTIFDLSVFFQTIRHLDAFHTGLSFIPLTAVLTISTMISSRVAKNISALHIITFGFSLQIVGFILLSRVDTNSSFWLLNGSLMLVGIGSSASVPSITNTMLSVVSHQDAGISSGIMASARQVGGIIGVAIFGALITHSDVASFSAGMSAAMLISAVVLFTCIIINFSMFRGKTAVSRTA